jgi:hypothetical protein
MLDLLLEMTSFICQTSLISKEMKREETVFYVSYDDGKGRGKVHPRTGHEDPEESRSIALIFL